jgi:hypothetical protein
MKFKEIFKDSGPEDPKGYKVFKDSFLTGRNSLSQERISFQDAMNTPNSSVWLPRVISEVAREAVEPNLILTNLLDRVEFQPGIQIIFGATGALTAADIAEGQAYPEQQIQLGGASVTANVGKSGVAFKLTEEMRSRSQFDIINLHIRAAGRALARHKEKKVATYLSSLGVTVFDNSAPTSSLLGVTTGRDVNGNPNGSITWDDMFDLFGVIINNGFMPDLIIMHPLTWVMFMKDPVLRSFALAAGGGTWWGSWTGNPAGKAPWDLPKNGPTTGQNITPPNVQGLQPSNMQEFPQAGQLQSSPQLPSYFLPFAVRIIVTPFMYYDPATKRTDLIVCDSSELGALIVEEELFIDQWMDKSVEIEKIKLREKYGIHIYNEGLAIAVAKNVKVEPNAIVLPARAHFDASSLPAIDPTVAVC